MIVSGQSNVCPIHSLTYYFIQLVILVIFHVFAANFL